MALHPYPHYTSGTGVDCPTVADTFIPVQDVEKIMSSHGDAAKPIWLTEIAWSDLNGSSSGLCWDTSYADPATPQENRLTNSYKYVSLPGNVSTNFWWLSDREHWGITCQPYPAAGYQNCGSGLLAPNLTPNPIYTTLSSAP